MSKIVSMASQYGASPKKMAAQLNAMTYEELKAAVAEGKSLEWINTYMRPVGVAYNIMRDLYDRATQELWEENELIKTKAGRLLYV